jgi:hypothetical protein
MAVVSSELVGVDYTQVRDLTMRSFVMACGRTPHHA